MFDRMLYAHNHGLAVSTLFWQHKRELWDAFWLKRGQWHVFTLERPGR